MYRNKGVILLVILLLVSSLAGCSEQQENNNLNLTVQTNGRGTVSENPDKDSYEEGTKVTLTASPKSNFKHWSGALEGEKTSKEIVMDQDYTVFAQFKSEIVFEHGDKIYIMNEDGSDLSKPLTDISKFYEVFQLHYLPQQNKVAFIGSIDTGKTDQDNDKIYDQEIYTINLADGKLEKITDTDNDVSFYLANWSADGEQIVISFNSEIYLFNISQKTKQQLTDNDKLDGNPIISPSGKQIVFISSTGSNEYGLYKMDIDGSDKIKLIDKSGLIEGAACFSPSGDRILIKTLQNNLYKGYYIIDKTGDNKIELDIPLNQNTYDFAWLPGGEKIAFQTFADSSEDNYNINIIEAKEGAKPSQVAISDSKFLWLENKKLAFVDSKDGKLYTINPDGSNKTKISTDIDYNEPLLFEWLSK